MSYPQQHPQGDYPPPVYAPCGSQFPPPGYPSGPPPPYERYPPPPPYEGYPPPPPPGYGPYGPQPPPPPPPYQGYQSYFRDGYPYAGGPTYQVYQCGHNQSDDCFGCFSFLRACLGAICCCFLMEECCFLW